MAHINQESGGGWIPQKGEGDSKGQGVPDGFDGFDKARASTGVGGNEEEVVTEKGDDGKVATLWDELPPRHCKKRPKRPNSGFMSVHTTSPSYLSQILNMDRGNGQHPIIDTE